MHLLTSSILSDLTTRAQASERLRMNYNLHATLEDKVHRIFNALEPGTEIPIHRHQTSDETILVVRGSVRVQIYSDNKEITADVTLKAGTDTFGIDIKACEWHKCESLEPGTVIFEVKAGPYVPIAPEDILPLD